MLDATALLSHARGHVHVGELLVEIAEEGAYTALPTTVLTRGYAQVHPERVGLARLGLLPTVPGVHVLGLDVAQAPRVARYLGLLGGDLARAHAVWAALNHDAYLLTSEPDAVAAIVPADQIHYIPTGDS